jgi:hypothetical protein
MEVPPEVFNNITSFMDVNTKQLLSRASTMFTQNIVTAWKDPIALKKRIENLTDLEDLPLLMIIHLLSTSRS